MQVNYSTIVAQSQLKFCRVTTAAQFAQSNMDWAKHGKVRKVITNNTTQIRHFSGKMGQQNNLSIVNSVPFSSHCQEEHAS